MDVMRGWNPASSETELYAKLLGLLLQHWVLLTCDGWQRADRSLVKSGQAIREYARLLCLIWQEAYVLACVCMLIAHAVAATGHLASHSHHRSFASYACSA